MKYSQAHFQSIRFHFMDLKAYMKFMEEYIENASKKFDEENDEDELEKLKSTNEEYYYHRIDTLSERWHEINRYYPHNFRASILIQICSGIEYELTRICDNYHRRKATPEGLKEMKGKNEFLKIKKFLKMQANVNFSALQKDWEYIDLMRRIRNLIVHHQAGIKSIHGDWNAIKSFILANPNMIEFKDDINEKDEDGVPYHKSRPQYSFPFIINSRLLNDQFFLVTDRFFNQLLHYELSDW